MKDDGTLSVIGGTFCGLADYAKELKEVSYVAAGPFVAGAIKKDGTLVIWERDVERFANEDIDILILLEGSEGK